MPTPTAVETSVELPFKLRETLRSRMSNLQMLPGVAVQAMEIARDPECSIREFANVVEKDGKLASDILKLSNSPLFATGGPKIPCLSQAIVRLGFRQCRNLILSASMTALMRNTTLEEQWIQDSLCRHGYLTALLAMGINRITNAGFHGEEFAAGLIHDFGRTVLAACLPEVFSATDPVDFIESKELLDRERQSYGADHCQVGRWFAETNQLPSELVEVIGLHHTLSSAHQHARLIALIAVSDHMANSIHRNEKIEEYDVTSNAAIEILEDCGVENAVGRLRLRCAELMEKSRRSVHEVWPI